MHDVGIELGPCRDADAVVSYSTNGGTGRHIQTYSWVLTEVLGTDQPDAVLEVWGLQILSGTEAGLSNVGIESDSYHPKEQKSYRSTDNSCYCVPSISP